MQVIRWGGRGYLIEPDETNLFAAAVNFGIEPRTGIINRDYLGRFFLRSRNESKAVTGKPALPERWMSYLHDSPIRATVTKMQFKDQKGIYTVNKGAVDGVKVGMVFIDENETPNYFNFFVVISVEGRSAEVKGMRPFPNYQVGNSLVTKIVKGMR